MRGHWSLEAFNNVEAEVIFELIENITTMGSDLSRWALLVT